MNREEVKSGHSLLLHRVGSEVLASVVDWRSGSFCLHGERYVESNVYLGDFSWLHGVSGIVGVVFPFACDFYPEIRSSPFVRESQNVQESQSGGELQILLKDEAAKSGDEFWVGGAVYLSPSGEIAIMLPQCDEENLAGSRFGFRTVIGDMALEL